MHRMVVCVDEEDRVKGEISHAEAHTRGLPHRVSAVYITNDLGHILVQVRAFADPLDHSAADHLVLGEEYLAGAYRALREEVGIEGVELREIGHCLSNENIGEHKNVRHMLHIFECRAEPKELNPERVLSVFWADPVRVWQDMQRSSDYDKYCGGFRATLKLYLKSKGLLPN